MYDTAYYFPFDFLLLIIKDQVISHNKSSNTNLIGAHYEETSNDYLRARSR